MFNRVQLSVMALCLAIYVASSLTPVKAQGKPSAQELEPTIKSGGAIYLDGERIYRSKETEKKARITARPEPSYTMKARENKVEGIVELRAILTSAGEVKVLYTLRELPDGLTEQALKAAKQIRFKPAEVGGKMVSIVVILQYNFNL